MQRQPFSRRHFLQLSAVTAAGLMAACAPVPAAQPCGEAGPSAPQEKVAVTFMVPGSAQEDADFAPVFEEFNKRYPEIDGQYTPAGTGYTPQYDDKLLTMLAGGTAPDVFKTQFGKFGAFAASDVYLPMDDLAAKYVEETAFDDFFDAHVEACYFDGKLLALPNDGAPEGIWYNVDLYDDAGQPYPTWDTTWDNMLEAATAITKQENNITVQHGIGHPFWLETVWSNGGEVLSEDGTKCLLDSPEAVEALTWMQDLVITHGVAPGPEALSELGMTDRFTSGRLGSFWAVRGSLGALRTIEGFSFDAAPIPTSNKGTRLTRLLIGWTSVWNQTKHPDEAYLLAAWVASPEGQRLRISRGFAHPSRKSLVDQDWYAKYECPMCNSFAVNTVFPEMLLRGEARAWPSHAKEAEIFQTINTNLDSLWDGSKPAEQVAVDMTTAINGILQE